MEMKVNVQRRQGSLTPNFMPVHLLKLKKHERLFRGEEFWECPNYPHRGQSDWPLDLN